LHKHAVSVLRMRADIRTFFCHRQATKESMKKYNMVDNPTGDDVYNIY